MAAPEINSLVSLENVTKVYQKYQHTTTVLKDVSLTLNYRELLLILGPSGSGKTTLLTLMAGFRKPTSGKLYLFGRPLNSYDTRELQLVRAARLGFVFQQFYLIESLTVIENVRLVMHFTGTSKIFSRITAMKYLEIFGIDSLKNEYPATLSQGEKQRVAVARALVNGARLIIADEPTGSLSSDQGMTIVARLKEITREEKRSVIIVSHDERIMKFADRLLILEDGVIREKPLIESS